MYVYIYTTTFRNYIIYIYIIYILYNVIYSDISWFQEFSSTGPVGSRCFGQVLDRALLVEKSSRALSARASARRALLQRETVPWRWAQNMVVMGNLMVIEMVVEQF